MADDSTSPGSDVHKRAQEYMQKIALAKETAVKQAKETIEEKWGPSPRLEPNTATAENPKPSKKAARGRKWNSNFVVASPTHGGMTAGIGQHTPQRQLQRLPDPVVEQANIAEQQRSFQQQLSLSPDVAPQLSVQEQLDINLAASIQHHYRPQHLPSPEHSQQPGPMIPISSPPAVHYQSSTQAYQQPQITIPKQTYDNLTWENSALTYLLQKRTGCTIEEIHDWLRNEHKDKLRRQQELARRNQTRRAQLQQAEVQQAHAREAEMWRLIGERRAEVWESRRGDVGGTMIQGNRVRDVSSDQGAGAAGRLKQEDE